MNGRKSALEAQLLAQFFQGHIRLFGQQSRHLQSMGLQNDRLATRAVMLWADVAALATLLDKLLNHAQRNLETVCDFLACAFLAVIGTKDSFP